MEYQSLRAVIPVVIRANTGPIADGDATVPALSFAAAFLAASPFGSAFLEVVQVIADPTVFAAASVNERIFFSFVFHPYLPLILDCGLRIADFWNRCALSIISVINIQ